MSDLRNLVDNHWRLMERQIGKNNGGTELWQNWGNIVDTINASGDPILKGILERNESRQHDGTLNPYNQNNYAPNGLPLVKEISEAIGRPVDQALAGRIQTDYDQSMQKMMQEMHNRELDKGRFVPDGRDRSLVNER